ncbi:hypothetical protein AB6F95_004633 [Salmonella enterica]
MKSNINLSTLPDDLISTTQAQSLAGVGAAEWKHAKRYNPSEFPANYSNNCHGKYSIKEVKAFFSRFKK